jgi:hypothetical protein
MLIILKRVQVKHVLVKWTRSECLLISLFFFSRSHREPAPITVAARSKAWTLFVRCNTEIVGSNPSGSMDVCLRLFCVCVLCVGSGLATDWSPVQGVLPATYRTRKTEKQAKTQQKGCRALESPAFCQILIYWHTMDMSLLHIFMCVSEYRKTSDC